MRRVLITGGSGGIGSAVARACADRGLWPVVAYAQNRQRALETVADCGVGEAACLDLLEDRWDLQALGQIDAVAHCAGLYARQRALLGADTREMWRLIEVNALAPLRLTEALVARERLKHCIFLLSTAISCRGGGPYALSKATALATCKLLALELAPRGVRVDAIVPGWTETPMAAAAALASGRNLADVRASHPGGHLLAPEDVARLVVDRLTDRQVQHEPQLVLWDLRDGREPVWTTLDSALSLNPSI